MVKLLNNLLNFNIYTHRFVLLSSLVSVGTESKNGVVSEIGMLVKKKKTKKKGKKNFDHN